MKGRKQEDEEEKEEAITRKRQSRREKNEEGETYIVYVNIKNNNYQHQRVKDDKTNWKVVFIVYIYNKAPHIHVFNSSWSMSAFFPYLLWSVNRKKRI